MNSLLRRLLSPAGFLLTGLCFLLPFVAVSCSTPRDHGSVTYTGATLVVGGRGDLEPGAVVPRDSPGPDAVSLAYTGVRAQDHTPRVAPQPFAILALVAIGAGTAAALVRPRFYRALIETGLALVAVTMLSGAELLVQPKLRAATETTAADLLGATGSNAASVQIDTDPRYGFWLALLLLAGLAGLGGYRLWQAAYSRDRTNTSEAVDQLGHA